MCANLPANNDELASEALNFHVCNGAQINIESVKELGYNLDFESNNLSKNCYTNKLVILCNYFLTLAIC